MPRSDLQFAFRILRFWLAVKRSSVPPILAGQRPHCDDALPHYDPQPAVAPAADCTLPQARLRRDPRNLQDKAVTDGTAHLSLWPLVGHEARRQSR